jgi:ribosomal-protein-alanine N-acetyltransferase
MRLLTPRLELVAATYEHVCVELVSPDRLGLLLNAIVPPDWPPGEYDRQAQESFCDKIRSAGEKGIGWYIWYLIRRGDMGHKSTLVGAGGFLGPPDESNDVEIGISILPRFEGCGYATEAVRILIAHAFSDMRAGRIVAHTTRTNPSAQRLLIKSGFRCIGHGPDPDSLQFEISRIPLT